MNKNANSLLDWILILHKNVKVDQINYKLEIVTMKTATFVDVWFYQHRKNIDTVHTLILMTKIHDYDGKNSPKPL